MAWVLKMDEAVEAGLVHDFDASLAGIGQELGTGAYSMSDVLALPIFKEEDALLPLEGDAKQPPFQYILCAETSPAVKLNNESLTYLNQGQSYEIRMIDNRKVGDIPEINGKLIKSTVRLVFHDRRLQYTEHEQLEGWRWNRPGDRLLDLDVPMSVGIIEIQRNPAHLNTVEFLWDAAKRTSAFIQVHCISTEFTPRKHGGEKGVPFRVQVDTYKQNENGEYTDHLHSASCQVKVFKPKGADRKQKTDREKMEKRTANEKEKFQPSYNTTILSEMSPEAVMEPVVPEQEQKRSSKRTLPADCGDSLAKRGSCSPWPPSSTTYVTENPLPIPTFTPIPQSTCTPIPQSTCPPIPQSTCPPIPQSTCPPIPQSTCPPIPQSTCPPIPQSTCPPIPQSNCPPIPQSTCPPIPQSTCPPIPQSSCPPIPQSTCSPIPQSTCTSVPQSTCTSVPQSTCTSIPQSTCTSIPQSTCTAIPQSTCTAIPQSTCTAIPQSTCTPIPQSTCTAIPQSTCTAIPQSTCAPIPQSTCTAIPQSTCTSIPQSTCTPIPQSTCTYSIPETTAVSPNQQVDVTSQCFGEQLHPTATIQEAQQWLLRHRFSTFSRLFANFSGADLLKLTREDLVQICGPADGIRLYNALKSRMIKPRLTIYVCQEQPTNMPLTLESQLDLSLGEHSGSVYVYHAIYLEEMAASEVIRKLALAFNVPLHQINQVYRQGPTGIHVLLSDQVVQNFQDESCFLFTAIRAENGEGFHIILK